MNINGDLEAAYDLQPNLVASQDPMFVDNGPLDLRQRKLTLGGSQF